MFSALIEDLHATVALYLGDAAVWTPQGGLRVSVRTVPAVRDMVTDGFGQSLIDTSRRYDVNDADMKAAAIAAGVPGQKLARGDTFEIGGEVLEITGDPRREDDGRYVWTFEAH